MTIRTRTAAAALLTFCAGAQADRVLFVRGADRSGGFLEAGNDAARTEQLADINNTATNNGNHGWGELSALLTAGGFDVVQIAEPLEDGAPGTGPTTGAPIPFETLALHEYDAIVLGSNNATYSEAQVTALENYVRSGGGLLFISDANFGGSWADAPTSDQPILDRFGWTMQQDQGTYILRRSDGDFVAPTHPILAGVDAIDGEGVSPIVVPNPDTSPGVVSTVVVRAKPGQNTRNNDAFPGQGSSRAVTAQDATLAVATADGGRIAGHFDRNTFFNLNGAGTSINRFENATYATNLFTWLTDGPNPALRTTNPVAYQPVTLGFASAETFDELTGTNPFLDRRLQVLFTAPDGRTFDVPGYFDTDGSGATSGDRWRTRFTPDQPGTWSWSVSFRQGAEVAIDLDPLAGTPTDFDGRSGAFAVQPPDPNASGFLKNGKLLYDGTHHLRFTDGTRYVKVGVDSPENWLGYTGFDNTVDGGAGPNTPDGLHAFPTHAADWNPGDPDWDSPDTPAPNDGRAIIGALNYLASTNVNAIYFLPMNIGGDGKDSWPYASTTINPNGSPANDNTRFDTSKLAQWERFFGHAQASGILLHVVLTEAEAPNKNELDDATLGTERKLYYRELIARFAHHNAIKWNISEEYNLNLNLGAATVLGFADYIKAVDPYGTPVTVHNAGSLNNPLGSAWGPFIGADAMDLTSLQQAQRATGWSGVVESFRAATADAGRPIPIMIDEPGSPTRDFNDDFDAYRKQVVWPILMSGGSVECFINNRDQALEDFREFDKIWTEMGHARTFIESLPFWEMTPEDARLAGNDNTADGPDALVKPGEIYAAYLPDANPPGTIALSERGNATLRWFNPRTGQFLPDARTLTSAATPIPLPPSEPDQDWALAIIPGNCPCDFDDDTDAITVGDLLAFLERWFGLDPAADLDADGTIDVLDLLEFLTCWFDASTGATCP